MKSRTLRASVLLRTAGADTGARVGAAAKGGAWIAHHSDANTVTADNTSWFDTRMRKAMPRASHLPQRHHPRQLKGMMARRPPETSTQQARTVTTTNTEHRTLRHTTHTAGTVGAGECITNNNTSAAHRSTTRPQRSSTSTPERTRALTTHTLHNSQRTRRHTGTHHPRRGSRRGGGRGHSGSRLHRQP
jgi:hypothetical protein